MRPGYSGEGGGSRSSPHNAPTSPVGPRPCEPGEPRWVPCGGRTRGALAPDAGSLSHGVGSTWTRGVRTTSSGRNVAQLPSAGACVRPVDLLHPAQPDTARERVGEIELATRRIGPAVDDLGEHARAVERKEDPRAARKCRVGDALGVRV